MAAKVGQLIQGLFNRASILGNRMQSLQEQRNQVGQLLQALAPKRVPGTLAKGAVQKVIRKRVHLRPQEMWVVGTQAQKEDMKE